MTAVIDDEHEGRYLDPTKVVKSHNLPDTFTLKFDEFGGVNNNARRRFKRQFEKVRSNAEGKSKKASVEVYDGYSAFKVVQPPYNLAYLAKLYELDPTNYPAVNAKIANTVGLGYELIMTDEAIEELSEINSEEALSQWRKDAAKEKRRVQRWIDSTNDEDSFEDVLVKVMLDYETTGNAYIEIGRTSAGNIGYIGHVPSHSVRVRRDMDGFVQIVGRQAVFFRNFNDVTTPNPFGDDPNPNELIHFKKFTPTNQYYGIPDVIPAINSLLGHRFASQYNIDYFENKAVPRYAVVIKGGKVTPQLEDDIFSFFSTHLKGENHRSIIIPLPADSTDAKTSFEMKPVEAGVQESSFGKFLQQCVFEILAAHRVPISKISVSSGISLAQARDADKTFKEQVTRPIQRKLENKLKPVLSSQTRGFRLKFNELALTDEDTQSKIDERYLRLGVILPNEVRARRGEPAIEGGDKPAVVSPQRQAEERAQASGNRRRDQERQNNSPDNSGEGRNEQGAGRQQG